MKTFAANEIEGNGAKKVYLPEERIGVFKKGDQYFVFEAGDEKLMNEMLAVPKEYQEALEREKQATEAYSNRIEMLTRNLEKGVMPSESDLAFLLLHLVRRV